MSAHGAGRGKKIGKGGGKKKERMRIHRMSKKKKGKMRNALALVY